jgi:hypothetical protein
MKTYSITQEIITQESAEDSYVASSDYWEVIGLRDACKEINATRTNEVDGIESISAEYHNGRLMVCLNNSMEFRTGDYETRYLHAHNVTRSSAARIARIIGARL